MGRRKKAPRLECKDGRYYENGKYLPKRDYIYHSSYRGTYIISCRTGQLYRQNQTIYI